MTKLRMPIPRLTEDEMREIVRDRLACKVMFSLEISDSVRGLCMMPVAMGALSPPEQLRIALLGSAEAPETLEGEPDKPQHPGYPDPVGDPPEKPALITMPDKVRLDLEFGDLDDDDEVVVETRARIVAENTKRIREWETASLAWDKAVESESRVRREIDADHSEAVKAWEADLAQHTEAVEARKQAQEDWRARYDDVFGEWLSDLGEIMGRMKDSFPRGINGYPIFHAVTLIHKDDWTRIKAAILREQERAETLAV